MKNSEQISLLKKQIIKTELFRIPATLAVTFGVIAKFSPNPEDINPILGNTDLANGLLIIGIPLTIFYIFKSAKLKSKKKELESISDTE